MNAGEIRDAIGRDVATRVAKLIEKLLFHGVRMDAAAGARMFGDDEAAVGIGFDDWIADIGEIGNVQPIHLAVAARTLRAAFDDVSRDSAGG